MSIETKYATIDRDELKRLQADSAELARLREPVELEVVAYVDEHGTTVSVGRQGAWISGNDRAIPDCWDRLIRLKDAEHAIAQAGHVPEGFVLVPVEPTREMLVNVDEYVGGSCYSCSQSIATEDDCRRVWAAMLAAAPKGDSHE